MAWCSELLGQALLAYLVPAVLDLCLGPKPLLLKSQGQPEEPLSMAC